MGGATSLRGGLRMLLWVNLCVVCDVRINVILWDVLREINSQIDQEFREMELDLLYLAKSSVNNTPVYIFPQPRPYTNGLPYISNS